MTPAFLDPAFYVGLYESNNNYSIGVGGENISVHPVNNYGFPIWSGFGNPVSHAAGRYQFEPATWAIYAIPLRITDFSPRSQDAVFAACFSQRRFADWLPFNTKLAAAVKNAGGEAMFSLGAMWLTMSGGSAPSPPPVPIPAPPPPPPPPSPEGENVIVSVSDPATGRRGSAMIPLVCVALAAMVLAGATIMAPKSPTAVSASAAISPYPVGDHSLLERSESARLFEHPASGNPQQGFSSTNCVPKDLKRILIPSPCAPTGAGR